LYLEDDDKYVVTGSGAGSAEEPQWFKNLQRTDQAEIEVGRRHLPVSVEITDGAEREVLWQRLLPRALLRRLPEEGRAPDTYGSPDAHDLTTRILINR
jgi:hypothetical protein